MQAPPGHLWRPDWPQGVSIPGAVEWGHSSDLIWGSLSLRGTSRSLVSKVLKSRKAPLDKELWDSEAEVLIPGSQKSRSLWALVKV